MINQTDGEVIYLKHNTSFVFLQGRAGDALTDHSLVGPTYLTALQREAAGACFKLCICLLFGCLVAPPPLWRLRFVELKHEIHPPNIHHRHPVFRRHYYRAYWFEALKIAKPPEMGWGRYLRKRTAAATGFHNFFSNSTVARRLQASGAYKYVRACVRKKCTCVYVRTRVYPCVDGQM